MRFWFRGNRFRTVSTFGDYFVGLTTRIPPEKFVLIYLANACDNVSPRAEVDGVANAASCSKNGDLDDADGGNLALRMPSSSDHAMFRYFEHHLKN